MGMTIDDFETKAIQVLLSQRFLDFPLFVEENLSDYNISDIQGEMNLEDFIRQYAEEIMLLVRKSYENRLKADMVAMLTELQMDIEELDSRAGYDGNGMPTFSTDYIRKNKVNELIQQKINALKGETDDK